MALFKMASVHDCWSEAFFVAIGHRSYALKNPTLVTAAASPRSSRFLPFFLSDFLGRLAVAFVLALLGLLRAVARQVQFDDDAVMH